MGPIKPKSFWTAEFFFFNVVLLQLGFPGGSAVKNLPANAEDVDLTPMLGRSPREGNSNPLLYSYLGNPMDREAWQATVQEVTQELDTT